MRNNTTIDEELVLTPRDAQLHSDDWPEFELRNVRVHEPDRPQVMVSLLEAAEHHPLTVTGTLQPRYGKASTPLYIGKARSGQLQLTNVVLFAYGELEDGAIAIWAAGKSGWFSISPHHEYQSIYNDMTEAIKILYFVIDAYRRRKNGNNKYCRYLPDVTVEELFEAYAQKQGDMDAHTAAARIFAHRRFLLATMLVGKEDIAWSRNGLFLYLCDKFPDDVADIKERIFGTKPARRTRSRQGSVDTSAKGVSAKRKRQQGSPLETSKLKNEIKAQPNEAIRLTRSSRSQPSVDRPPSTESETPPSETDSAGVPVVSASDEEEAPTRGRKRKSLLRLKPLVGIKGTPRPTRAAKISESDEEPDESPVAKKLTNGRPKPPARDSIPNPDTVVEEPEEHDTTAHVISTQIAEQLDPVQEDTWNCPRDGCMHKVYLASHPDSQRLIQEHNELHVYDVDARVKMVQRLQAPSLPVKHLMERVRMQAKADQFPSGSHSQSSFPSSVVQRY